MNDAIKGAARVKGRSQNVQGRGHLHSILRGKYFFPREQYPLARSERQWARSMITAPGCPVPRRWGNAPGRLGSAPERRAACPAGRSSSAQRKTPPWMSPAGSHCGGPTLLLSTGQERDPLVQHGHQRLVGATVGPVAPGLLHRDEVAQLVLVLRDGDLGGLGLAVLTEAPSRAIRLSSIPTRDSSPRLGRPLRAFCTPLRWRSSSVSVGTGIGVGGTLTGAVALVGGRGLRGGLPGGGGCGHVVLLGGSRGWCQHRPQPVDLHLEGVGANER